MQKISLSINVSKWEAFAKLLTFHEAIYSSLNNLNTNQMFIIARNDEWVAVEIISSLEATNALLQTVNNYKLNCPL